MEYTISYGGLPNWSRSAQTIEDARAIIRAECGGYMDAEAHVNESDACEVWNESAREGCNTYAITNLDGATTHSEFMRTPGNGVARNSAFIQTWMDCEPAILYWAECDDMFLRFRFDPEAEISQMPIGVYFDAEAFIAAEETD